MKRLSIKSWTSLALDISKTQCINHQTLFFFILCERLPFFPRKNYGKDKKVNLSKERIYHICMTWKGSLAQELFCAHCGSDGD